MEKSGLNIKSALYRIGMWFSFCGAVGIFVNRMSGHGTGWQAYIVAGCLGIASIAFACLWERVQRPWKLKFQKACMDLELLEHVPPELVRIVAEQCRRKKLQSRTA